MAGSRNRRNEMDNFHTLLIDANGDTTCSFYGSEPNIGDIVTCEAKDENGNTFAVTGRVLEVLA